jgi:hypothetical protein
MAASSSSILHQSFDCDRATTAESQAYIQGFAATSLRSTFAQLPPKACDTCLNAYKLVFQGRPALGAASLQGIDPVQHPEAELFLALCLVAQDRASE